MHARVVEEARKEYTRVMWRWRGVCATMLAAAPLAATAGVMQDLITMTTGGGIAAGGVLAAGLVALQMNFTLARLRADLLSDVGLDARFERCHVENYNPARGTAWARHQHANHRCHVPEVSERDEFSLSLWRRVRPQVSSALLCPLGLSPAVKRHAFRA